MYYLSSILTPYANLISVLIFCCSVSGCLFSLQCFDIVGWATVRASGLQIVGCWFVGCDTLTEALHVL